MTKPHGNSRKQPAPELSVLLPALNPGKECLLALRSLLIALPRESEVLVLAEGDLRNLESLQKITDSRLRVFIGDGSPPGISEGLNFLLAHARSAYVARMDADDITLPWRFTRQLRAIKRKNVDFVFSNAVIFGRGVRPFGFLPQPPFPINAKSAPWTLGFCNPFVHPTMLAKRSTIEELGGYDPGPSEDYNLWLRASLSGFSFHRLSGYDLLYRVHPGQLSKIHSKDGRPIITVETEILRQTLAAELTKTIGFASLDGEKQMHLLLKASEVSLSIKLYFLVFQKYASQIGRLFID